MPNTPKGGGISRKIFNPGDRKKIRNILNQIEIPKEMELLLELRVLIKLKMNLLMILKFTKNLGFNQETAMNSMAPSLIHHESEIIKRTLRDMYDEQTKNF